MFASLARCFQGVSFWQKPVGDWRSLFSHNALNVIQLNSHTQETEIILVFGDQDLQASHSSRPHVVDMVTNQRLELSSSLQNEANLFDFDYFAFQGLTARTQRGFGT